jgi:hypothetical protein
MAGIEWRSAVMTGKMRAALFILSISVLPIWSLDISQGRMKVALNEGTGRFSVSYMTDLKSAVFKPLLVANDPRTSVVCIAIGNKVYRLGESMEFRTGAERTDTGGKFVWLSSLLTVEEEFSFTTSQGASVADGIRIDLKIKNVSEQDLNVAVRIIFDTYLGEASYVHFKTDKIAEITRELTISKAERASYWASPLVGDPDEFGLICPLTADGVTSPDRVVFANWKRLTDASWGYETVATRNFNLMPYSVNDSAVSHYYDSRAVAKGSEWTITTILGKYSASGYTAAAKSAGTAADIADSLATLRDALAGGAGIKDALISTRTDLSTIDRLIAYINKRLSSSESISQEELSALSQILTELEARRTKLVSESGK